MKIGIKLEDQEFGSTEVYMEFDQPLTLQAACDYGQIIRVLAMQAIQDQMGPPSE